MRWTTAMLCLGAWMNLRTALAQNSDSTPYRDSETGLTFTQYPAPFTLGRSITYRIAVPSTASTGTPFDVVVQILAPSQVGWAGLAWAGKMANNALTVCWSSGQNVVVSSRYATDHNHMPTAYSGASYTVLKAGTWVNSTHWQLTAKCVGCSTFSVGSRTGTLQPTAVNHMAFAFSATKPSNPSSNQSTFSVHDVHNYWNHDFAGARNADFVQLVAKAGVK